MPSWWPWDPSPAPPWWQSAAPFLMVLGLAEGWFMTLVLDGHVKPAQVLPLCVASLSAPAALLLPWFIRKKQVALYVIGIVWALLSCGLIAWGGVLYLVVAGMDPSDDLLPGNVALLALFMLSARGVLVRALFLATKESKSDA